MDIRVRGVVIAVACSLCACSAASQPSQDPPPGPEAAPVVSALASHMEVDSPSGEATMSIARALIAPTPAMLAAALSNDPDAMRDALVATASTCQASSSCPAQFGSCGGWSTPSLCNETCGAPLCRCRPIIDCDGEPPEPSDTQTFNSFRVCFDANHNACTEWTSTQSRFCGC